MKKRVLLWFFNLLLIGLFAGCSGGGSSNNDITDFGTGNPTTNVNSGIAVDPYIAGAIFEEVSAAGTQIIQNSTASDSTGHFSFANPVQNGSTIRMKISNRGIHGGAPFKGLLKRTVGSEDDERVVVSPLTTLLANGMGENEVIAMLANAGLSGLEPEDLTSDPMQGLVGATSGINERQIRNLQANMAINALLQSVNNFDYAGEELTSVRIDDFVSLSQETLNAENFQRRSNQNLDFGEYANAAVDAHRTVVSQIRQQLDAGTNQISADYFNQLRSAATEQVTAYLETSAPVVVPPTDPGTPPAAFVAADFFNTNCAMCHSLTGNGIMNLTGDGAKLDGKFGNGGSHNGSSLEAAQITALAAYLGAGSVVDTPTNPDTPSGDNITASYTAESFFNDNCTVCHNIGTSSSVMNLAGDGAFVASRFGNGTTHNGLSLTANDIQAMESYLDANAAAEPPPTPVTGPELYASECQGCHGNAATSNISSRTIAGISAAIDANVGGMGYLVLTDAQLGLIVDSLPAPSVPTTPMADRSGVEVYDQECSSCHILGNHDAAGAIDLASRGSAMITKIEGGHMGKSLSANELAAVADYANTFSIAPPPVIARTADTIYNNICASCHMLSGFDEVGSIDLAGKGSTVVTKIASGHGGNLSNTELTEFATWVDTFSPPAPPAVARTGEVIYNQTCAACHKLYGFDTLGNIDLASMGNVAVTKLATGHGGTFSVTEQQNIADWLDTWAPAPPPLVDRNGETVYNENCAVCHKLYGYDAAGNVDLASQGGLAVTKLATGHGGSPTNGEVINLTNWLDTFSPAPPPTVARGGQTIYDAECTGCHKVNGYDASGTAPDIAGNGSGATTKLNAGHNGINLLAEELVNLGSWLDSFQAGDPYAGSCTACHGQPPQSGAHEVHSSLADIGTNCAVCHETASHNGTIDLAIPSTWNAKSGSATSNGSTCSNISCHGGQTTPNWISGTLDSSTQCKSCHTSGTIQYNSYASGKHRKHVESERFDCLVCHDATKLGSGHFSKLSTIAFEQNPASTLNNSVNYSGGSCTLTCHGEDHRNEGW